MRFYTALLAATLALSSAASGQAQLLPFGEFAARDGRPGPGKTWKLTDAAGRALAAQLSTTAAKTPVVIDYEHQTLLAATNGRPAPAAGWITSATWRDGQGLFATVQWTAAARAAIDAREYQYISPVITSDEALVDYLSDRLVELGESVPETIPGFRLDTGKNPWQDPRLWDYKNYPEDLFVKPGTSAPNRAGLAKWGAWAAADVAMAATRQDESSMRIEGDSWPSVYDPATRAGTLAVPILHWLRVRGAAIPRSTRASSITMGSQSRSITRTTATTTRARGPGTRARSRVVGARGCRRTFSSIKGSPASRARSRSATQRARSSASTRSTSISVRSRASSPSSRSRNTAPYSSSPKTAR